jgi:uncharacterized protein
MTFFADTSYYIASLAADEPHHAAAAAFASTAQQEIVTTEFVLLELAAYFSKPPYRSTLVSFVERLRSADHVSILPVDADVVSRAWQMFRSHGDKSWSLTDCTSFVVMRESRISVALSTDHHFEQAGFQILFK